ncbi:alpha/beta fold hydrolase [Pedococcus bigeumensis]|uniref:Alpha/beta fold hydrolase n=2 Tax=Pedococcus bigeumensis TaxID=433644 RepID=A0A502CQX4_9MICO|nr:alpha/beta fold hydrolase [Pedococcus bigeumensis]
MRDGLVFDVTDRGGGDDVAVLLHGWPQDRHAWAQVTPLLTEAGLRVVAPDQRGYSPGALPTGRAAYRMSELVADVLALVDALGESRVHLVGHDWGGSVAWAFAERHPERLLSLTVVSTPHHRAIAWAMRHADQARRSWYMAAFQLPVVPELVLRRRLPVALRRSGLPEQDVQRYAARFRLPGMARGGLGWYRAIPLRRNNSDLTTGTRRISTPATYVWGRHDPALGRAAAERTRDHVAADYSFVELDAGHWLPETHPREVAAAILERRRTVEQ